VQFAPAWGVRDRRRRGEVAPAEFYCSLEDGVRRELLRRYSDFRREGNFPESKLSGVCSGSIRNTHSTSGNRFFCSGGILFTQSTMWVFRSAGNPPPRGNSGLKRTRRDAILKKFEFKINFKLKISVKRDRTNFRSIQ
jgi:hypothetical protein